MNRVATARRDKLPATHVSMKALISPRPRRRSLAIWALLLTALTGFAQTPAEPAPDSKPGDGGDEAADQLWHSFLQKYAEYSLAPLPEKELDEKARQALLESAGPLFRSWKPDSQPTFLEMVTAMKARDANTPKFKRVEQTLATLLPKIDTYGQYTYSADCAQLREALQQKPGSIQMTLERSPEGKLLCFPQPDGPAGEAGVNSGAELLAVDKRPVEGKSLAAMRLAFVGPPDTPVVVKIRQPQGKIEELSITRSDKEPPSVTVTKGPLGLMVRIRKFDRGSGQAVKQLLEPYPNPGRITFDLRGNLGGLRDEALKTASLFFPEGTVLGKFTSREGVQSANDGNGVFVTPTTVQILQDRRTASGSEYLIATLKEGLPGKVTIFGENSYGKSHSTARVVLDGGGEMSVTETLLSTASGRSWDKTGISPDNRR